MDNLELLKLARQEREHAEQELVAWNACTDAVMHYVGGGLTKTAFLNFCRTQRDDKERQGFYRAADVYRRMIDMVA